MIGTIPRKGLNSILHTSVPKSTVCVLQKPRHVIPNAIPCKSQEIDFPHSRFRVIFIIFVSVSRAARAFLKTFA